MRYRYRAGTWTAIESLSPVSVLAALADDLLGDSAEEVLNRTLHQGMRTDSDNFPGLDAVRRQVRESLEAAWADVDWNVVREHLKSAAPVTTATSDVGDGRTRKLAATPHEAIQESRRGGDRRIQSLVHELAHDSGETAAFSGTLRRQLEKLRAVNDLLELESLLGAIRGLTDLEQIDSERLRQAIGEEAARDFSMLVDALQRLEAEGFVQPNGHGPGLSPRALSIMAQHFLARELNLLTKAGRGGHHNRVNSGHGDRTGTSRPLGESDRFEVDITPTVIAGVKRTAEIPVSISLDDFHVFERESRTSRHTVLAIDTSRSMNARQYLAAAKRLTLSLTALIQQRYSRDRLDIIAFSRTARRIPERGVVRLDWDRHDMGTNVQDGLALARRILRGSRDRERQIILITDGEPTAFRDPDGEIHYIEPPTEDVLAATYAEARKLAWDGINLTVAVISPEQRVITLALELARHARGETLRVDPETLTPEGVRAFIGGR